nr:MAG TPA: hypothetical protein [Caudoviricetes sp.]
MQEILNNYKIGSIRVKAYGVFLMESGNTALLF